MYISANSGTNWTTVAFTGQYQYWTGVASSADGTKLVAVDAYDSNANNGAYAGVIYTSSDSGLNWNASTIMSLSWASVACSYDGSKIILSSANYQGNIKIIPSWLLTSTDAGATWQPNNVPTSDNWAGVTSSADGTKLAAVNNDQNASGNIYTYALPATNTPTLNIATAGANSFLFWPWPATGYVLQQNTNLTSTNWVSLAGTPAMMNLLIAPQTNNQNFYRLVHP